MTIYPSCCSTVVERNAVDRLCVVADYGHTTLAPSGFPAGTLQYDKVIFILAPSEEAKAAIGKRITVIDHPDGGFRSA